MYLAVTMFASSLLIAICYIRAFYVAIREARQKESSAAKLMKNVHNIRSEVLDGSEEEDEGISTSRRNSYQ